MLIIRQEQFDAFEREALKGFVATAIAHLRGELSELVEDLDDAGLTELVYDGNARAAVHGFSGDAEILAFIDAGVLMDDPAFDTDPENWWAAEILGNSHMTSRDKALALLDAAWAFNQDEGED
jgi:hypothetical protein